MKKIISFALIGAVATSCLTAEEIVHRARETSLHAVPINIVDSKTPIGFLNSQAIFLADQLERNLDNKYLSSAVMVTSFLSLDDLSQTNSLGRLLSESLIHELQVRKWRVIDARLVKDIVINKKGEFALSRDIKNIKTSYNVGAIVTGTYTITETGVVVNAKVMDIDTGVITSSGQISVPLYGIESLLYNYKQFKTVKVKGSFE